MTINETRPVRFGPIEGRGRRGIQAHPSHSHESAWRSETARVYWWQAGRLIASLTIISSALHGDGDITEPPKLPVSSSRTWGRPSGSGKVNPAALLIGAIGLTATWAWILSDWRVRSARSIGLMLASLMITLVTGIVVPWPLGTVIGVVLGVAIAAPVIFRNPAVMPWAASDAAMIGHMSQFERRLVLAGKRLRRGDSSIPQYERALESVRSGISRVTTQDAEWRHVLQSTDREIRETLDGIRRGNRPSERAQSSRASVRGQYWTLAKQRRNFWR